MLDPVSFTIGSLLGVLVGALVTYFWLNGTIQALIQKEGRATSQAEIAKNQLRSFLTDLEKERKVHLQQQERIVQLTADLSRMSADYDNISKNFVEHKKELGNMESRFQHNFESLANRILKINTEELSSHNREQLHAMLGPLKERLHTFEQKVQDTYDKEARERFHLRKEIESLMSLNMRMSEDAQNLTRALKGDNKAQGNWGEMILSRVLESSGLRLGEEYDIQKKLENDEGAHFHPDVIIKLPEDKHIIVDSKVSLTAYERFLLTEDEKEMEVALVKHVQSIETHVKQLSEKHYHNLKGIHSPDFVLMFMPIEAAFSLALQTKSELFTLAWEKRIVVVSPTTLLASLRTISSIWKLERQNKNAEEIARQGGMLYDKFVNFTEEMSKIGKHLDQASRTHNDAMRKLSDGKGNLVTRAERLRELGIKNNKRLNGDSEG